MAECEWCEKDEPVLMLDEDGVNCSLSKKKGTPCHAYDDKWWPCGYSAVAEKPVATSRSAPNTNKGKRTYRVASQEQCASCTIAERCTLKGIPENEVFKYLTSDKLFAFISDGCECYCSAEVVPE